MLHCNVQDTQLSVVPLTRTRVCAVSYLNTVPLVWGMLHGPQQNVFDLSFSVPSICSDNLRAGAVDIGLIPCAELNRQPLFYAPEVGISCRGAVRSILLISQVAPDRIRTLAVDSGSRSSVMLARIVLDRKFGARPTVFARPPELISMLGVADAALIIGDPALRIDPAALPYTVLDLGAEWFELTGLPMVFAVWAGRQEFLTQAARQAFLGSWEFGRDRIDEIVRDSAPRYGVSEDLVRQYLTRHIVFELGEPERRGLELYLRWAADLDLATAEALHPAQSST